MAVPPPPRRRIANVKPVHNPDPVVPNPNAHFDESDFYDQILDDVPVTQARPQAVAADPFDFEDSSFAAPAADPFDFEGGQFGGALDDDIYPDEYEPYKPGPRSMIAHQVPTPPEAPAIPQSDNSLMGKAKAFIGQYQQAPEQQLSLPLENKSRLQQLWEQSKRGFNNAIENRKSVVVPTPHETQGLRLPERVAYGAGALAGDVSSDISRGLVWRWNHPLALTGGAGTKAGEMAGLNPAGVALMGYAGTALMDATTGNVNWSNLAESGRPDGYQAIYGTPENPTETERPVEEFVTRYFVGRTGKILPWEQFHEERPDVSPEEYVAHKKYQQSEGTLGVLKGTWNGIDGPEAQFMGYRVPLTAALQTGGALAGAVAASKLPQGTGRIAAVTGKPGRMLGGGLAGLAAGKVLSSFVD